jgi:carbon-monoxide dehydrogenase medium subunit
MIHLGEGILGEKFKIEEYHRPQTIQEAQLLLARYGPHGRVLAGGTDLLVQRPEGVKYLIDIKDLHLDYIRGNPDGIHMGAMTTFSQLLNSPLIHVNPFNVLTDAAKQMGHRNIRNLATIGGNICNAVPSADLAPPLIVLDSRAVIAHNGSSRIIPLIDFFTGVRMTKLKPGELLLKVFIPQQPDRAGASFKKLGRTKVDIALVNTAVRITVNEDDVCTDVRVILGSVASTPIRSMEAENTLVDRKITRTLIEDAALYASEEAKPISDTRASAEYRREMTQVLVKRAIKEAHERARDV